VKWILKYLKGTSDFGLEFGKASDILTRYVDFNYASDLDKRRSLTRYIFIIGGCVVSWKATLQHAIALSTTEAKYLSIVEVNKEVIWLKGLLKSSI